MAKITDLAIVNAITGDEFLPVVQGGATKRATMTALRALIVPFLQYWYKGDPGNPGPAGNVAVTVGQLRAAPTTNATMIAAYDGSGSTMTWTTGDFTASAALRPADYVKANGYGLAEGAWVRQGAGSITFVQQGGTARPLQDKAREGEISPDDFPGSDSDRVQAAFDLARDRGGATVRLQRSYAIYRTMIVYGGLTLLADAGGRLDGSMMAGSDILQDSSVTTPTDINAGITIGSGVEIIGGGLEAGTSTQIGIHFYRTPDVTLQGVIVHGVGGSGIRWGHSQIDCHNVVVEKCIVYGCRMGDAIQGVGRRIIVRDNNIGLFGSTKSNFGDTGGALLYDFDPVTNPGKQYPDDWEFSNNTIIGNYTLDGEYVGTGQQIQTGIAVGPFKKGHKANGRIIGNRFFGCYLPVWLIAMDDVLIERNTFGPHAATATGALRLDGVTNAKIRGNEFALRSPGTGPDYCAIFLHAGRFEYGASVFDEDVSRFEITGNVITSLYPGVAGIRLSAGQVWTGPDFTSRMDTGRIEGNSFVGVSDPVVLAPVSGDPAGIFRDVIVQGNTADITAGAMCNAKGNPHQYVRCRLSKNACQAIVPTIGSGAPGLKVDHDTSGIIDDATSGVPVDLLTLPAGIYVVEIAARVENQGAGLSASATVHVNGSTARLTADNGAAMTLANPSGRLIQATQSVGQAAPVNFELRYKL